MPQRPSFKDIVDSKTVKQADVDALANGWEVELRQRIDDKTSSIQIPTGAASAALIAAATTQFEENWTVTVTGDASAPSVVIAAKVTAVPEPAAPLPTKKRVTLQEILTSKVPAPDVVDGIADAMERTLREQITADNDFVTFRCPLSVSAAAALAARQFEYDWDVEQSREGEEACFEFSPKADETAPAPRKEAEEELDWKKRTLIYLPMASSDQAQGCVFRLELPRGDLTWYMDADDLTRSAKTVRLRTADGLPYRGVPYVEASIPTYFFNRYVKEHSVGKADEYGPKKVTLSGSITERMRDSAILQAGVVIDGCIGEG